MLEMMSKLSKPKRSKVAFNSATTLRGKFNGSLKVTNSAWHGEGVVEVVVVGIGVVLVAVASIKNINCSITENFQSIL